MKRFSLRLGLTLTSLLLGLAPALTAAPAATRAAYAPPRFNDDARRQRIDAVLAEVDRTCASFATERHLPGLVYGIVLDGQLVHTGAVGFANLEKKTSAATDTRFRIASMTKSFTALAIYKLRDAGKLSLADPVEKFLPEFRAVASLTTDAAPITLHHLLTMTAGFPEDNPWGDRQLAVTPEALRDFIRRGVSLSEAPGSTYEYSNLGFALLGQIISRVAGEPFQTYLTREILVPLGMKDTRWEYADVPADKLALGYRWENDAWRTEPLLHDGAYGAMGGLLTTLDNFSRYVTFHLAAYPPRDDADSGPIRRATVREMHQPTIVSTVVADAKSLAGAPRPFAVAYAHGLRWSMDSTGLINLGHGGGLPGFGSFWRFYPTLGLGIIAFANLTYAPAGALISQLAPLLVEKAALTPRALPVSATLATRQRQISELLTSWEPALCNEILAENFFLDRSRDDWMKFARETLARAGRITATGALVPENQLRGTFALTGEKGRIDVFFTLTPEAIPKLQHLRLTFTAATP